MKEVLTIANPGEEIIVDWQLDLGCYTFVMQDAYGDGLHASWANNGATVLTAAFRLTPWTVLRVKHPSHPTLLTSSASL